MLEGRKSIISLTIIKRRIHNENVGNTMRQKFMTTYEPSSFSNSTIK